MTHREGAQTPEEYMEALAAEDELLLRIKERIRDSGMPEVSVAAGYGKLLTLLVSLSGARRILEIGALGGYSGVCMARGMGAEGSLTSLELQPEYAELAGRHLEEAGFGGRTRYLVGPALEGLAKLKEEGETFDFFFIDADKGNYLNYLDLSIELAEPGAVIVADNLLLRGRTLNRDKNGPSVLAVREFNRRMAEDERLEGTLLPAYDGLAVAMVKKA
ncbi:O-methyltransferase [Saccharibacillus sp. CPCC 101409]|uniref:O-methyltransferase n=1 Tax=Saccharibacillus sp. CPCC 101409 TaxID=3058041 RepID=UPI002672652F|nr:O-methyltransferase [Saccharibacillus sp. CPCC 101409]MDO3408968.1 O-methyltransferase [Saccharibacillus sp. CPCC 101409]